MPTYDFKCEKCGHVFEEMFVKYDLSNAPKECPKCKQPDPKRVTTAGHGGFDCIGPGFYMNDYGKHDWKKNLNKVEQAKVLAGDRDPY